MGKTVLNDGSVLVIDYTLAQAETGAQAEEPEHSDMSVQVGGTFGGGTVVLEGSNDGTTFHILTDPLGNNASFTSADLMQIIETCRYVRPRVTGGNGTTAITVHLLMGRPTPMRT